MGEKVSNMEKSWAELTPRELAQMAEKGKIGIIDGDKETVLIEQAQQEVLHCDQCGSYFLDASQFEDPYFCSQTCALAYDHAENWDDGLEEI